MLLNMEVDRISAARFRVLRESLGFSAAGFAKFASVKPDTVNDWDSGRSYVPKGIVHLLHQIATDSDALINETVARLKDHPSPTLVTYRSDDSYAAAEPDSIYPASWHRMVAGRVWEQIPNLTITYI